MRLLLRGKTMGTPMRSSAADRDRPTFGDGLVVLLIVLSAAVLLWTLRPVHSDRMTVLITLDGKTVAEYTLQDLTAPVFLPIDAPWPLTVELQADRVRIAHSDCPSQDCVHTGWIDTPGQQIICLPDKLIISLTGADHASPEDFDTMVG